MLPFMTLKIDAHNHILPAQIPDFKGQFGYGGFIQLDDVDENFKDMKRDDGVFFRRVERNCWDIEKRLEDMDEFNVDVQVLSTVPVMFSYWAKPEDTVQVNRFLNEDIQKSCERYPKRFVGLGSVPMQDPELAARELENMMKTTSLKGVQIGSHIGDINMDDERMYPFWETVEKTGASVMVHPWDMMGKDTMPDYWLPWLVGMPAETSRAICCLIFGGILDKYPNIKVMFAHGGGSFPGTLGRIEHGYNVRPDLCAKHINKSPREYVDKIYIDSITHDPVMLNHIIKLMGEDRIMLGTDYPFPLGELTPGRLIEGMDELSTEVKAQLLGGTALDWLGMKPSDF